MIVKYYSCKEENDIRSLFDFDGNYYEDQDMFIVLIGKVNTNDLDPESEEELEPIWSDFLFNVLYKTEDTNTFDNSKFEELTPETPMFGFFIDEKVEENDNN